MPHASSVASDDFASTDEVKVYKDEGEDEKRSSENLSEEKHGLLTETEEVSWPALACHQGDGHLQRRFETFDLRRGPHVRGYSCYSETC